LKKILYWFPSIAYASIIFFVSSIDKPAVLPPPFPHFDKIIHFFEYGIFTLILFYSYKKSLKKEFSSIIIFSAVTAAVYGISDEYHQSFTVYRSAEILDWFADLAGILSFSLIIKLKKK